MVTRREVLLGSAGVAVVAAAGLGAVWWRRSQAIAATGGHFEVTKTPAEWREILTPAQYAVLREEDTERPFTSPLNNEHRKGTFACAGCTAPRSSIATNPTPRANCHFSAMPVPGSRCSWQESFMIPSRPARRLQHVRGRLSSRPRRAHRWRPAS